jgi:hypothetical protein
MILPPRLLVAGLAAGSLSAVIAAGASADANRDRLVAALLGPTPLQADLQALSESAAAPPGRRRIGVRWLGPSPAFVTPA